MAAEACAYDDDDDRERVIAVHDYVGESDSELTLRLGDVIIVVGKKPSGWWVGLLNGKKGYFPSNHVREYDVDGDCQPIATPPRLQAPGDDASDGGKRTIEPTRTLSFQDIMALDTGSAEILERMQGRGGVEVKNRSYRFRTYKNCFIGSEAVTWLVENEGLASREEAVQLGREFGRLGVLRHVTNEHEFSDGFLFFKFCTSEEEYRRLYNIVSQMRDSLTGLEVKDRRYQLRTYKDCFIGSDAVDWMMLHLPVRARSECVKIGQKLAENKLISHVAKKHTFKDDFLYYHFAKTIEEPADRCDLSSFDALARFNKASVCKEDFQLIRVIGQGGFGKVLLVQKKDDEEVYAMKVIPKDSIRDVEQITYLRAERNILANDFPFIAHLYYSFQSEDNLYLVMDFFSGGDLFGRILDQGRLVPAEAAFVAAEIILALRYLHENGIIWRDLKPENVLYDSEGHICITDFGISKEVGDGFMSRTTTVTGTPQYLAPEVLTADYDTAIDYWALGVCVYQMLVGRNPYDRCADDTEVLERLMAGAEFPFPLFLSDDCVDVIQKFCAKNPAKRLGTGPNGFENVKAHPFFAGLDWEALRVKKCTPPWKPVLKGVADTSNFAPEFTNQEVTDTADFGGSGVAPEVASNLEALTDDFDYAENNRIV